MNRLNLPARIISLSICLLAVPQLLFSQVVKEKFDKLILSENFDSINTYWTTLANAENLFIVQDGEYILQRKAPSAPYAIIANFEEEFNDFRVVASMKLDKSMSDDATVGFLFMMQAEGQGGFLCEINKKKEFRLRQIVNGSYKYLTGNSKEGGWVRSSALNETNFSNMIEIRTFARNYDLYINSEFILSFAEPTYKTGKMGLIIGPASRGKIDFIYVFTITSAAEAAAIANTQKGESSPSIGTGPDMIELAESIIKLKTQINGLNEENEDLRKTISAMKTGDQERDVTIKNMEKQVKNLQDQIRKKEFSMDSLSKANTELLKYKEMVGGNENADLVITLSKAVKAEKEKSTQLEQENKELREKLGLPKSNGTKSVKPNGGTGTTPPAPKKEPNVFSLPKDN